MKKSPKAYAAFTLDLAVFSGHSARLVNLLILVGFFYPELNFGITDNYKAGWNFRTESGK
ncbi:MAG: hypothetical protein WD396_04135 [Pseudohongiellaceae bacterium]